MIPYPPGDGVRDEKLLDKTDTHVLWSMRSGSKIYWVICTYDGKIVDAAFTRKSKAYDAWETFKMSRTANRPSAARVASRYLLANAEVWLPDYLGAGASVADAAVKLVKEIVIDSSEFPQNRTSAKAAAGGLLYHLLKDAANLPDDAKHLWPILDRNAGLHAGGNMWRFAERVYRPLMRGVNPGDKGAKALRIAGLGVELLQRTQQPTKAKVVNDYFVKKYGEALTTLTPGREKGVTQLDLLTEAMTPEIKAEAARIAVLLRNDPKKAVSFIEYICTDSNFHSLASAVEGVAASVPLDPSETEAAQDIAGFLEYGGEECAAFGVSLFDAMGATTLAAKFARAALKVGKEMGIFSNRLASVTDTGHGVEDRLQTLARQNSVDGGRTLLKKHMQAIRSQYGGKVVQDVEDIFDDLDAGNIEPVEAAKRLGDLWGRGQKKAGDAYLGNPNGQSIYQNSINHGYREPLAGGTDVMRKLQNQLLHEQGREQRPESPRLANNK